jgi:hypothetical protein
MDVKAGRGQHENEIGSSVIKLYVGLLIREFDDYPQRSSEPGPPNSDRKLLNLREILLFLPCGFNFASVHQLVLVTCFLIKGWPGILNQRAHRG